MIFEYKTPEDLLAYMSDFDYTNFDTLMNPVDVCRLGEGSCHDQTFFELEALSQMGLQPKAKFLMAVDSDNIGGETHSFAYWVDQNNAYWFENAWSDYQGIHKCVGEEDMLVTVISYFRNRNPYNYIFLGDFNPDEHTVGEDLDTFVDICMENAILV